VAAFLLAGVPLSVAGHERWFTPEGPYWAPDRSLLLSLPVALALGSGALVVLLLTLAQRALGDPLWPRPPFLQRLEPSAAAILGVQTAITMIFAATRLQLFAPNIQLPRNLVGLAIAGLAILAAFTFITGVLTRWGAALTIGLLGVAFFFVPWYEVLEQVIFAGIALYLLGVGRGVLLYEDRREEREPAWSAFLQVHALTILRLFTGATVLVLAFTEKLVAPGLGVAFLQEYPNFNVARGLGLEWFTDERFVFAAGIVEATAGIALLSGKLIRVVILLLWIPFNLGIPYLPAEELIGHLPILATMYVLLVRGTAGIPPRSSDRPRSEADADDPFAPQPASSELTRVPASPR
jgi:uncharacterized membrane protein YphA (DoxX/SURF4 family)